MLKALIDYPTESFKYKAPEKCNIDLDSYLARFRKEAQNFFLRPPEFRSYKIFVSSGHGQHIKSRKKWLVAKL